MSEPVTKLAIIIPSYNEEARIAPTLARIREYLQDVDYSWTVTVISDGSTDATPQVVQDFAQANEGFSLDHYQPNRGKGYAIRRGMLNSDAEWILFSDADLAAPIEEIEKLWKAVALAPIAIGSRPLKESRLEIRQPWYREQLGRLFNRFLKMLAIKGIDDTQCGFKLIRSDVAKDVFSRCKLDGFGFDFESLMIARDLGYPISEVPIRWSHQEGSKVILLRDGPRMLADLLKLRLWGEKKRLAPNPEKV